MKKIILGVLALALLAGGTMLAVMARSNPYEPAPVIIAEVVEVAEVPQMQVVSPDIRVQAVGSGLEAMLEQRNETAAEIRLFDIGTIDIFSAIDMDAITAQIRIIDINALVAGFVQRIRDFDRGIITEHIRDFDISIVTDFIEGFDAEAAVTQGLELAEQFGHGQWFEGIDFAEYIGLFDDNRPLIIEWLENFDREYLITEILNFDIEPILEWLENLDINALIAELEVLWSEVLYWIEWFANFDIDALMAEIPFIAQLEALGVDIDAIITEMGNDIIRQQMQSFGLGDYEDIVLGLVNRFLR